MLQEEEQMLVNMKKILEIAEAEGYAIPCINTPNEETVRAVIGAAEELNTPIIIDHAQVHDSLIPIERIGPIMLKYAKEARVPVCVHLDHGSDYEFVMRAVKVGFPSIMYDCSALPFEENVEKVAQFVKFAHAAGITVEAELGKVGGKEDDLDGGEGDPYTNPQEAAEFVERTGIDSLAVAIGTAHGIYPSDMKPELRLDILQILKDTLDIPLVLHGGSSNKDEEIAKAVKIGISKINISSDIKVAFYDKCREVLNAHPEYREPLEIYPEPIKACREVIAHKVNLFDSADKVKYYYE